MHKSVSLGGIKVLAQQSKSYTDKKCSEILSRFDMLDDEIRLRKSVDDSDGVTITDSNGSEIMGKTVYVAK